MTYADLCELIWSNQDSSGLEIKVVWLTLKNYADLMASLEAQSSALYTTNGYMLCGVLVKIDKLIGDNPGYFIEYIK